MATLGGAKALGLASDLGSLEPGKRADVTVVNPSRVNSFGGDDVYRRLVYSVVASQVEHVLVDGRQVMRDGQLLSLDEGQVMSQAEAQLGHLLGRL
jgi:cytosine/adenosine deaminase-related metal-dependent hydrolase